MSVLQKIMCLHCKNVSALQKGRRPQDTLVSKNVSVLQKERRPQIYFSVQNLERESEFERGRKKFKINEGRGWVVGARGVEVRTFRRRRGE